MSELRKIQNEIQNLNSLPKLKDKINSMKKIKENIISEQKKAEKLIKKITEFKPKLIEKYQKKDIDTLEKMFNEKEDFNDKLEIYTHLCYKIEKIEDELFGEVKNSDSEEIEIDSDSDSDSD